jgi:hypothetical protein
LDVPKVVGSSSHIKRHRAIYGAVVSSTSISTYE